MKRTLFLAFAAAAFSLASCSKDDSYAPSDTPGHHHPADPNDNGGATNAPKRGGEKPAPVKEPQADGGPSEPRKP